MSIIVALFIGENIFYIFICQKRLINSFIKGVFTKTINIL